MLHGIRQIFLVFTSENYCFKALQIQSLMASCLRVNSEAKRRWLLQVFIPRLLRQGKAWPCLISGLFLAVPCLV